VTDEATGAIDAEAAALAEAERAADDAAGAFLDLAGQLSGMFDPLFAAEDATRKLAEAQNEVTGAEWKLAAAQKALNEAIAEHGPNSDEAAEATWDLVGATEDLEQANGKAVRAAFDFEQAQLGLRTAVENGDVKIGDAIGTLDRWVAQGRITQEQADITAEEFRNLARDANSVPDNVTIDTYADTAEAIRRLRELDALARSVGQSPLVNRSVRSRERLEEGRWTGGPMLAGKSYMVGEDGPELIRMSGGAGIGQAIPAGQTRSLLEGGGSVDRSRHSKHEVHVHYPPDRPSTEAISHELRMIELGSM